MYGHTPEHDQQAAAIAKALTQQDTNTEHDWRADTTDYYLLIGPVVQLHCRWEELGAKRGRLEIHLDSQGLHEYLPRKESIPTISVSTERPAVDIAREITRRLLPEAQRIYRLLTDAKAAADDYKNRQACLIARLASALGTNVTRDRVYWYGKDTRCTIEAYGERVKIEISSLPGDLGEQICKLLAAADSKAAA